MSTLLELIMAITQQALGVKNEFYQMILENSPSFQ